MGGLLLRQKVATERVKYLDLVLIPRSNLYKSNIEGPCSPAALPRAAGLARAPCRPAHRKALLGYPVLWYS